MGNVKMIATVLAAALAACTTVDVEPSATSPATERVLWIVHTHAACDGARIDDAQRVCVAPDPARDVDVPGDHGATEYAALWQAACLATQGNIGTPDEAMLCVIPGTVTPAPYGCDTNLELVGAGRCL
jgi:hypothetical protein